MLPRRVRDAMTTSNLVTVRADATVREVRAIFARYEVDVIPVLERDERGGMRRLLGVVTRAEILQFLLAARSPRALSRRLEEAVHALARRLAPLPVDTSLARAAARLLDARIEALPVSDRDGHVIGMLSMLDVLDHETRNGAQLS